jgi:predicted PurR-regulated permease PerM
MDEAPAVGTDAPAIVGAPEGTTTSAATDIPRFRPLELPSAPFWVVLIGGFIGLSLLLAAASALLVFAIGVALSFFLVPVVNWLVRHGVPRIAAAILVVVVLVVITLAGLALVSAILIEQGVAFVQSLPTLFADLQTDFEALDLPSWLEQAVTAVATTLNDTVGSIDWGTWIIGFLQGLLGMVGLLFSFMLLPFFLFYLLKDQPRMAGNFYRNVPAPWKADVSRMITICVTDFAQYFKAEILVGSIMFLIVSVGMFVIGSLVPDAHILVEFALLLGLAAFVFELLPQIGPILAYLPALLLALTVSPVAVAVVSVFYFVIFNIEGSILVPTFEGRMISFSGATVLVLIAMGFALGGIIGAIVALPVAAIARDLFGLFFLRAQEQAGLPPPPDADDDLPDAAPEVAPAVTAAT